MASLTPTDAQSEQRRKRHAECNRKWAQANREKVRANQARWHRANAEKRKGIKRAWCEANPDKVQAAVRRATEKRRLLQMGVNPEQFAAMLVEQNGVCASCGQPETAIRNGRVIALAVDHDHETGRARHLLCRACNVSLGHMLEDENRLLALAAYAKRIKEEVPSGHS